MEGPKEGPLLEGIIGVDTLLGMNRGGGNQLWMAGPAGAGQIEHLAKMMVETTHPEVSYFLQNRKCHTNSPDCVSILD